MAHSSGSHLLEKIFIIVVYCVKIQNNQCQRRLCIQTACDWWSRQRGDGGHGHTAQGGVSQESHRHRWAMTACVLHKFPCHSVAGAGVSVSLSQSPFASPDSCLDPCPGADGAKTPPRNASAKSVTIAPAAAGTITLNTTQPMNTVPVRSGHAGDARPFPMPSKFTPYCVHFMRWSPSRRQLSRAAVLTRVVCRATCRWCR
jgi:hypothetical protein